MPNDILDAVVKCLEDEHQLQFHGSFVNYLVKKDYVRMTFNADKGNLALVGRYIKWREWLEVHPDTHAVSNDLRTEAFVVAPIV